MLPKGSLPILRADLHAPRDGANVENDPVANDFDGRLSAGRRLFREPCQGRSDQARQCRDVVATLEHGGDTRRKRCAAAAELAKAVRGDAHLRKWIIFVSIE